MNKISFYKRLNNLERANNSLKLKLMHEQLKHKSYPFHLRDEMLLVLKEYMLHKSIVKAANNAGIDVNLVIRWIFEGQKGNPYFRNFYLAIMKNNGLDFDWKTYESHEIPQYNVESVDGSWIYTAIVDGQKVSIISSDYEQLKRRISQKNLPF